MGIDLAKIKISPKQRSRIIDPEKIFESLTLRGTVENIWGPQAEAIKNWHVKRAESDIIVEMNTGGGKTLVGLLIAQSLVNETQRKVIYICPTNQLVEQAYSKAHECGLEVAIYIKGNWASQQVYDESRGPGITNYASVFNGKTIFRNHDLAGIIFDDAHVAGNTIRSQFSLKFSQQHKAFNKIIDLFKPYFVRNSQTQELNAVSSDWRILLFVPMFEVYRNANQLTHILLKHGVTDEDNTKFAWEHLKDHIDRCVILIGSSGIEITPVSLPLHRLPYFSTDLRRVYLTATLPSSTEFVRTFGVTNPTKIQPGGKSGEAQRLFVFLGGEAEEEQRQLALKLVSKQKVCIISPSTRVAGHWSDCAKVFNSNSGHAGIEAFAKSKSADKLVLIARYDGIDLPGDACRILILDGQPLGSNLIDRFIDQSLQIETLRSARSAVRLVQAIGRIFRSNTDHGVVILIGSELQRWFRDPHNQSYLPSLLQKQLQLGIELRKAVENKQTTFKNLINGLLAGDKSWDRLYQQHIDEFDTSSLPEPQEWLIKLVTRELSANARLWEGNCIAAAKEYASLAEDAENHDRRLAAWYRHWEGFAYDIGNDRIAALHAYLAAVNVRSELGRPKIDDKSIITSATVGKPTAQALKMASIFDPKKATIFKNLEHIDNNLKYGPDTKPAEQALCDLGELLGLESTRPDTRKREKTGPDVLWRYPSSSNGVALELKTDKKENSQYQKKNDIGPFHDHIEFLTKRYPDEKFFKVIVGPRLAVSSESHPPDDLRIITIEQFKNLASRVKDLYENVASSETREDTAICIYRWLKYLGLNWPNCVGSLQSTLAVDLKLEQPDVIAGE